MAARSFVLSAVAAVVMLAAAGTGAMAFEGITAPGDCAACHAADEQVLPPGHVPTAGMDAEVCLVCHTHESTRQPLQSVVPLDHFHMLSGVPCEACHADLDAPTAMTTDQCLVCHGPLDALAALTEDVRPTNPHDTPHGPVFAECDLCHRQHTESENFCLMCHDFEFTVP